MAKRRNTRNHPNPKSRRCIADFIRLHGTTTDGETIQEYAGDRWGAWVNRHAADHDGYIESPWFWIVDDLTAALLDAGVTITDR